LLDFFGVRVESLDQSSELLLSGEFSRDGLFASVNFSVQAVPDAIDGGWVKTGSRDECGSVVLGEESADGGEETSDVDLLDVLSGVGGGLETGVFGGLVLGSSKGVVEVAFLQGWDGVVGEGNESGGAVVVLFLEFLLVIEGSDDVSDLVGKLVAVALLVLFVGW